MTKCYVVKLENKYNPMITRTIVGYNTVDHAFAHCGYDKKHWKITEIIEK